jgi:alanine racemase
VNGFAASSDIAGPMEQAIGFKARMPRLRAIDAGRSVGYGARDLADRPRRGTIGDERVSRPGTRLHRSYKAASY